MGPSSSSGNHCPLDAGSVSTPAVVSPPGVDLTDLLCSRINQGQMLVTFADSHSALSVLDVDGMKVCGLLSFRGVRLTGPHVYRALSSPVLWA
jgi:hypothetical protein